MVCVDQKGLGRGEGGGGGVLTYRYVSTMIGVIDSVARIVCTFISPE